MIVWGVVGMVLRGPLRPDPFGQSCAEHNHNPSFPSHNNHPSSRATRPMANLIVKLLLKIFKHFSRALITTYDQNLYDIPFQEQFRLAGTLASCQRVCKAWRSLADNNLSLFLQDCCVRMASEEPRVGERLRDWSKKGSEHVKRLVIRLPKLGPDETRSIGPAILEVLAACAGLADIHCSHPLNLDMLPCHQNLTGLDRRFSRDSVTAFKTTLQHSPVLKYVTINLPASITTIGLDFEGRPLDSWIRDRLGTTSSLTNLVAMTSGSAYNALAKLVTAVDLRPSSGIFYSPPSLLYSEDRYEWVSKVSLKTSGSSRIIKERWNAFLSHLHFIPVCSPNLRRVNLRDDFRNWRQRQELQATEQLIEKRGIVPNVVHVVVALRRVGPLHYKMWSCIWSIAS